MVSWNETHASDLLPCSKTVGKYRESLCKYGINQFIESIKHFLFYCNDFELPCFSIETDLWSCHNTTYLGVSINFYVPTNYEVIIDGVKVNVESHQMMAVCIVCYAYIYIYMSDMSDMSDS